jgi:hypothetical protein
MMLINQIGTGTYRPGEDSTYMSEYFLINHNFAAKNDFKKKGVVQSHGSFIIVNSVL